MTVANNVTPAAQQSQAYDFIKQDTGPAGGAMGKDEFVKLLVTQMTNQDPLNPMDGKDLAVQLAQFSNVEQLLNINSKLDDLMALIRSQAHPVPTPETE